MDITYALTFCVGAIVMYILCVWDRERDIGLSIGTKTVDITRKNVQLTEQSSTTDKKTRKPVRIFLDGCWDVMHSGHYNAFRQAKALGDVLVVGVHSDTEIAAHKREPVMKNEQRMAAVKACKWADEVVFDVPYVPSRKLLEELNCDYVAHGDDIPIAANGHSAYHTVMDKLKIFRRTPGVSTTHLIHRLVEAARHSSENN